MIKNFCFFNINLNFNFFKKKIKIKFCLKKSFQEFFTHLNYLSFKNFIFFSLPKKKIIKKQKFSNQNFLFLFKKQIKILFNHKTKKNSKFKVINFGFEKNHVNNLHENYFILTKKFFKKKNRRKLIFLSFTDLKIRFNRNYLYYFKKKNSCFLLLQLETFFETNLLKNHKILFKNKIVFENEKNKNLDNFLQYFIKYSQVRAKIKSSFKNKLKSKNFFKKANKILESIFLKINNFLLIRNSKIIYDSKFFIYILKNLNFYFSSFLITPFLNFQLNLNLNSWKKNYKKLKKKIKFNYLNTIICFLKTPRKNEFGFKKNRKKFNINCIKKKFFTAYGDNKIKI
jgi:hypothetical protein